MTWVPTVRVFLVAVLLMGASGGLSGQEEDVPLEFRFVGSYKLSKQVKVKGGKAFPVLVDPIQFRIYTDGVSIRLYGGEETSGYTSFTIYRNDGVMVRTKDALYDSVPGVQAKSMVGNVMRQLTLTRDHLTLTKFPALSDLLQVTYALRVPEKDTDPKSSMSIAQP